MTGTTQLQGTSVPIWGFSASATPGTATAPGPVLVVAQNDVVTITVHNGLDQGVSLALPGQAADDISDGLSVAAQTTGAAPGGTRSYTFTARRAGHLPLRGRPHPAGCPPGRDGPGRCPGGPGARDGQASGHAYDDEQVLVLSELDPRLNADPTGFDMRGYRPRWRLINGRPFPATAPVSTDQGHTVLLRYVNAGAAPHPMSLLGASQLQVALDGHDLARAQRVNVQEMDAGTTADTLVTMPTGPETSLTLFETGSHLDNDGATELDPTKVAIGGMLTFLDTHAPPPLDDAVGPVTAHVGVDPATSAGTAPVTVSADLSDVRTGGSALTAAEYVVDDPTIAAGSGVPMTPDPAYAGPTAHVTGSLPVAPIFPSTCTPDTGPVPVTLACLSAGKHVVYVRGQDAAHNWGAIGSVVLNLPKTGPLTRDGSTTPAIPNGKGPPGDLDHR